MALKTKVVIARIEEEEYARLLLLEQNTLENKSDIVREAVSFYLNAKDVDCNTNLFKRNLTFIKITQNDTDRK